MGEVNSALDAGAVDVPDRRHLDGVAMGICRAGLGRLLGLGPGGERHFLPWLTATAFLHSIMIQERRSIAQGVEPDAGLPDLRIDHHRHVHHPQRGHRSVHAFALSNIGPLFFSFILLTMFGYLALLWTQLPQLRSANQLDSVLSRSRAFLFNNPLFVGIAGVTLFGTFYPIISDLFSNFLPVEKMSFAAPWFNKVTGPLFLLLIALMGGAPLLSRRRSSTETLRKNFTFPLLAGLGVMLLAYPLGIHRIYPLLSFGVAGFVVGGLLQGSIAARRRGAPRAKAGRLRSTSCCACNQRRYGGYIDALRCHPDHGRHYRRQRLQTEAQANLQVGRSMQIEDYADAAGMRQPGSTFDKVEAILLVSRNGMKSARSRPA